ncbi:ABC transporter ATP-binding protein [Bifidobacterium aquikefiri]|uniref:ABC transporter ATP-binding protein n=1 Tax=Bifidobacterium aquikefiri TaxID=1653207 RepID=UPI0039EC771E
MEHGLGIAWKSVSKTYNDGTVAVNNVSVTADEHRTLALVGSSGSGKTTLLQMVNRMVTPNSGTVLIQGQDNQGMNPVTLRRSIGYVLQNGGLLPNKTVLDNIATVPVLQGTRRKDARVHALELLDEVGLEKSIQNRYPSELSGGQQQRVGVARALAANPEILLMDEPFAAVDPIVRRNLQDELLRLQSEIGKTIVFVTHDIDEAFYLGDKVALLRPGGMLAQVGTARELIDHPADSFVASFINAGCLRSELQ